MFRCLTYTMGYAVSHCTAGNTFDEHHYRCVRAVVCVVCVPLCALCAYRCVRAVDQFTVPYRACLPATDWMTVTGIRFT